MTDEERGKPKDAEAATPAASSSPPRPPTPPPPDVSLFDEALGSFVLPDIERKRPTMGSNPALSAESGGPSDGEELDEAELEEPSQLELSDAFDDHEDSGRSSVPDFDAGTEPISSRRARRTLKIPDDDIPLSSPQPPVVGETSVERVVTPAVVVQAMRIISIGEPQPPSRDVPLEKVEPEDQLEGMEPLSALDVESTWTPPTGRAIPPQAGLDEEQLRSEEVEPIPGEPAPEDAEELEPEGDDVPVSTLPPVTVLERPVRVETPSPPLTAPLSPSASAPPPPMRPMQRSAPKLVPVSFPPIEDVTEPPAAQPYADEPGELELDDDEIAPASMEPSDFDEEGPPLPPPPPLPATPVLSSVEVPPPTPYTPPVAIGSLDATPQPPGVRPPKAPPPPKKRPKSELSKRERRARAGWEDVFADEFVRAYPRLTNKQVNAEVAFIERSLGIQRGGVVLDLGCGCGQHAVELASRGYNVVGYDLSLTMLAMAADEAQERGQKINFLQGDMREMAFEEMFDGIFSWGTSFGFFDEEKNISVIQRVHRALRKGGMFLLDLVNRDYICARLPSLAWFEGDGCVCIDDAQFNSITSRLRVKRTIMIEDGTSREVEFTVRLYSLHEIGKILHEAGFKVVEVSGHPATAGAFFDAESPRVITLAVRR